MNLRPIHQRRGRGFLGRPYPASCIDCPSEPRRGRLRAAEPGRRGLICCGGGWICRTMQGVVVRLIRTTQPQAISPLASECAFARGPIGSLLRRELGTRTAPDNLLHPRKYAQIEPQIGFFSEAIEPFCLSQQTTAIAFVI